MKKKFFAWICILLCLFTLAAPAETVRGNLEERFGDRLGLTWNGVEYRLRDRLTTILLAGVDQSSEELEAAANEFRNGGQADFQLLIVLDENRDTVQTLQINRDTMAEITVLSVLGKVSGSRTAQICLAHSFGDGAEQSCELLAEAVSGLLKGVPIDHYISISLDGISALNDALGGVEVTLEDDFSAFDPQMKPGETLVLTGEQAEIFVRSRHYVGDQTNIARNRRQQAYIDAASARLTEQVKGSVNYINSVYEAIAPYVVTDMSKGRIANFANSAIRCESLPAPAIEGEAVVSENGFMEFYPDEDSLMQAVIEVFFEPVG